MKAVGYLEPLAIDNDNALQDFDLPVPDIRPNDLLVEVKAVAVNPIDVKLRASATPQGGTPRILGFDASGVVTKIGSNTAGFSVGDEVYYAGAIDRQGSNSQYQAIDYRIVAKKPQSIDFKTAAAMPLTALTAYEMLFDRLAINHSVHGGKNVFLMIAGAGGVGSIALQLAKALSDVEIVATASRQESQQWCLKMGAHHVINHHKEFASQLEAIGCANPAFIFSTANSDGYLSQYNQILAPQGRLGLIDDPATFDIQALKGKSISVHWEVMFTRSLFQTDDMQRQGQILAQVAEMVDNGEIIPTLNHVLAPINATTLREAHQRIETNRSIGKIVIEGFAKQ